jgi:glycosyltransferase involved in cell wall biosynthesis
VRVLLVDPAAFTGPYDHQLASALGRAGAEVELVTSSFRHGTVPAPDGYRRTELFYPLSSRVPRPPQARMAVKLLEHPVGLARLRHLRGDLLHMQWLPAPAMDAWLFRPDRPSVFTAHDPLPSRATGRPRAWVRLLERFDRVIAHSDWGLRRLVRLGVDESRIRRIGHPVFASDPPRADDGRTLLSLGVIRRYKGLGDTIEVARRLGKRLLVAGAPREPVDAYRAAAGDLAEWRLGYLPEDELDRALGESTVALFPYRADLAHLDQSGALLRALGGGVPVVAYDVGGIAEPVEAYGAGRVVPAGDVDALTAAVSELLSDPAALAEARAGALRARDGLTWDAAAEAHLRVYRELA